MAIFDTKQKKAPAKKAAPKKEKAPRAKTGASEKALADSRLESVLRHPWMSEKALVGTEKGVYVFSIALGASKRDVALAVERAYKVVPVQVRVVNVRGKSKQMRGRRGYGVRSRRRKAYVYLKKGDTITF